MSINQTLPAGRSSGRRAGDGSWEIMSLWARIILVVVVVVVQCQRAGRMAMWRVSCVIDAELYSSSGDAPCTLRTCIDFGSSLSVGCRPGLVAGTSPPSHLPRPIERLRGGNPAPGPASLPCHLPLQSLPGLTCSSSIHHLQHFSLESACPRADL